MQAPLFGQELWPGIQPDTVQTGEKWFGRILRLLVILWFGGLLAVKFFRFWVTNDAGGLLLLYGIAIGLVLFVSFVVAFLFYRDPYEVALKNPEALLMKPLVSCMVAVRNEEKIIERCIRSVLSQTYDNREIIFVNDASTDRTPEILNRYAAQGLIRVIHLEKNVGKKRALGHAMLQARGEIFAFSDSDSAWAPDALEKVVAIFNHDPAVGAVSGHCRAMNAEKNWLTRVQDSWYEGQFSVRKALESVFGAVTCVSGPLAVFRRAAIYNYIPAWENDTFLGQEFRFATDRTMTGFVLGSKAIGEKLKQQYADSPFVQNEDHEPREWKVVYSKAAKAWTIVPDTWRRMLRQQVRWKKSFIRNMFFTGTFYWRKPLLPALIYYLHILFVIVGPLITFRYLIYHPLQGDLTATFLYLAGIISVGVCFGVACMLEDPKCQHWFYRPLMSLLSTLVLSWLVFYSAATIKRMVWARG